MDFIPLFFPEIPAAFVVASALMHFPKDTGERWLLSAAAASPRYMAAAGWSAGGRAAPNLKTGF